MDEIWERAVETALEGQTDVASIRALTLDGAVKCVHGRLPPPSLFEKFPTLQHLSIANVGASSLEQFPRLQNLQRLILSDNRIACGLEFLVEAGLASLRDLDLSNNRIQDIDDLRPLADLKLFSLDLYECPVTRVKDYRSRVFGLIKSIKYLDKMDAEGNERPESDDEEEEDEDEVEDEGDPGSGEINGEDRAESDEEQDDEDDQGSGEINGEGQQYRMNNGHRAGSEGIINVDEAEESDADEETETSIAVNGFKGGSSHQHSNGFRVVPVDREDEGEDEEENDSVDEIDDEEDVVEVHEIDDSDDEEDVVEYDDDDDAEEDEEDDDEVDNEEGDFGEPESTGRLTSTEGEIDGHEQGEEDGDEDDNGEMGEEEPAVEEGGDFDEEEADDDEEDYCAGYVVQPVGPVEVDTGCSDMDPVNEDDELEMEEEVDDEDDEDGEVQELQPSSLHKRKRDKDDGSNDDEEEDDIVECKSSKQH